MLSAAAEGSDSHTSPRSSRSRSATQKIIFDNYLIYAILILVDNCVWECGSLLPLFFWPTAIPSPKLSRTAKIALFRTNDLRNAIFVIPFFLTFIQNDGGRGIKT